MLLLFLALFRCYRYTGEQYDAGMGQYYLRARYYDPDQGVGRFTQMDTWAGSSLNPITLHKYGYANADPGNLVDPTGNFSVGSVMSAALQASKGIANPKTNEIFTTIQNLMRHIE